MGEKLTEHIRNEQLAREQSALTLKTRFIQIIRRYAKEKGLNIKDIL
jgi:hypothetical protein